MICHENIKLNIMTVISDCLGDANPFIIQHFTKDNYHSTCMIVPSLF